MSNVNNAERRVTQKERVNNLTRANALRTVVDELFELDDFTNNRDFIEYLNYRADQFEGKDDSGTQMIEEALKRCDEPLQQRGRHWSDGHPIALQNEQ